MPTPDEILASVHELTTKLAQILDATVIKPREAYEIPGHLPGACRVPRKIGTSLPEVIARALDRQVKLTGCDKNAVITDALLRTLPQDVLAWAVEDMLDDARRMWALTGSSPPLLTEGE